MLAFLLKLTVTFLLKLTYSFCTLKLNKLYNQKIFGEKSKFLVMLEFSFQRFIFKDWLEWREGMKEFKIRVAIINYL